MRNPRYPMNKQAKKFFSVFALTAVTLAAQAQYAPSDPYTDTNRYSDHKLESLANRGDANAAFYLGMRYREESSKIVGFITFHDKTIKAQPEKAVRWLHKAAALGFHDVPQETYMGTFYRQTQYRNPAEAIFWLQRASEQGSAEASSQLANMYSLGDGIPVNPARASQYQALSGSQSGNWAEIQKQSVEQANARDKAEREAIRAHDQAVQGRLDAINGVLGVAAAAVGVDPSADNTSSPSPSYIPTPSSSTSTKTGAAAASSSGDDYCKGHHAPSGSYCNRAISGENAQAAYCGCP